MIGFIGIYILYKRGGKTRSQCCDLTKTKKTYLRRYVRRYCTRRNPWGLATKILKIVYSLYLLVCTFG